MKVSKEINIGGKVFSLETGRFAKQADGAVMARFGDTMVLAAVVANKEANDKLDYFPLQVEYREKAASAGKIPGGFFKREARPSEKEILSSRLIDRPIRPMFPDWFQNETQVIVTVYSSDQEHDGDILGAVAASAALMISDIPFEGPIAEVRVGPDRRAIGHQPDLLRAYQERYGRDGGRDVGLDRHGGGGFP